MKAYPPARKRLLPKGKDFIGDKITRKSPNPYLTTYLMDDNFPSEIDFHVKVSEKIIGDIERTRSIKLIEMYNGGFRRGSYHDLDHECPEGTIINFRMNVLRSNAVNKPFGRRS